MVFDFLVGHPFPQSKDPKLLTTESDPICEHEKPKVEETKGSTCTIPMGTYCAMSGQDHNQGKKNKETLDVLNIILAIAINSQ